jgi:hypothetical protein
MEIRRIIKQTLNEVAGISFEVRQWSNIIEKEVEKHRPKPVYTGGWNPYSRDSYGYGGYDDYTYYSDTDTDVTVEDAFVNVDDPTDFVEFTYVLGSDLKPNVDIQSDFPYLIDLIKNITFIVSMDENGYLIADIHKGDDIDDYHMYAVDEMLEDYALEGGYFYGEGGFTRYKLNHGGFEMDESIIKEETEYTDGSIIIYGEDFPEAYENFRVDKFIITPPKDVRIEYDHRKSGYIGDEYIVYLNMNFSSVNGSILTHELKHAYDDWNRISKGYPAIRDGWEIKNIYTEDFEKLILGGKAKYPLFMGILTMYYLGSKLETPAYLENVYDKSYIVDYKDVAKKLMNFSVDNYTNKKGHPAKGLQEQWAEIVNNYDIPLFRKYPNVLDFLAYTQKYFNKRGRDIFKRISKMMYVHGREYPSFSNKKNKK